jgi:ZIP family zinc transporter
MDFLVLTAAGLLTTFATGLGVLPVWWLGDRAQTLQQALEGAVAGIMTVAAVIGLLLPALEDGQPLSVAAGLVAGVGFLAAGRLALSRRRGRWSDTAAARSAVLVVAILFVHSLPEGMAIGAAFASDRSGLDVYVTLAIALQNIPEGTATAIAMAPTGASRSSQWWAAIATSLPQPVGAVGAFLLAEHVRALLPASFAFAAGAMLALVAVEVLPAALASGGRTRGVAGILAGAVVMAVLTLALSPA